MAMKPDECLEDELVEALDTIKNLLIELDGKTYRFEYDCNPKDGAHELDIYYANEEQIAPEERHIPLKTQYSIISAVLNIIKGKIGASKLESENDAIQVSANILQMKGGT